MGSMSFRLTRHVDRSSYVRSNPRLVDHQEASHALLSLLVCVYLHPIPSRPIPSHPILSICSPFLQCFSCHMSYSQYSGQESHALKDGHGIYVGSLLWALSAISTGAHMPVCLAQALISAVRDARRRGGPKHSN